MPPANNGSTEDVQPPVVQIQSRNPNPEPNVAPVVTPIPKASIPFPSRRNDERRKEKANDQIEKFYEIFRDLSFEISFTSVILNKLPKKLGDPGRFLIPCEFTGITTCNALADLGASIHAHAFTEPPPPLPNHEQYLPGVRKELKLCEAKSSVDEPPEVELKELPPHLEYAFLEALLKVPQVHNRPSLGNSREIKGVSPEFCTHKILMDEDYEHLCKSQRGPWVSPGTLEPREIGMTVITNDENELIPTRLVTGWRVCIDYRKLNEATRKYHFPLPFMDTNVERLAGNQYYCFLDGFSGYFQIPIDPKDQEKTTFTCPYGTFAYRRMPFGLCNAPGMFQRCMMAIFHDMIEKTMDRIMDDFLVFGTLSLRADPFGKDVEACETPICL
ncbi:reverse transcriptase domain-containing protein [Tanacetum coccineum]